MATVPPKAAETPCLANRPCLSEACLEVGLPTQSPADLITCVLGRCPPPGGVGPGPPRNRPRIRQHVAQGWLSGPVRLRRDLRAALARRRQSRQPIASIPPCHARCTEGLQGSAPMGWNLPPSQRCSCSRKHGLRPEKDCAERISPSGYLEPKRYSASQGRRNAVPCKPPLLV